MSYANLHEAKRQLRTQPTGNVEDPVLKQFLNAATRRVTSRMGFTFEPLWESKWIELHTGNRDLVSSRLGILRLLGPMLEFGWVKQNGTVMSGVTTLGSPPWRQLRLADPQCQSWYACGPAPSTILEIYGAWGTSRQYDRRWFAVDAVQNVGGISDGAVSVEVADADALDPFGLPQRFSWGQLLRVEDEYLRVTNVVLGTPNTVTVLRGENGTIAEEHDEDTVIEVYYVVDDLREEVARQAALLYARRGSFEKISVSDLGVVSYPQDLLVSLLAVLQEYAYD